MSTDKSNVSWHENEKYETLSVYEKLIELSYVPQVLWCPACEDNPAMRLVQYANGMRWQCQSCGSTIPGNTCTCAQDNLVGIGKLVALAQEYMSDTPGERLGQTLQLGATTVINGMKLLNSLIQKEFLLKVQFESVVRITPYSITVQTAQGARRMDRTVVIFQSFSNGSFTVTNIKQNNFSKTLSDFLKNTPSARFIEAAIWPKGCAGWSQCNIVWQNAVQEQARVHMRNLKLLETDFRDETGVGSVFWNQNSSTIAEKALKCYSMECHDFDQFINRLWIRFVYRDDKNAFFKQLLQIKKQTFQEPGLSMAGAHVEKNVQREAQKSDKLNVNKMVQKIENGEKELSERDQSHISVIKSPETVQKVQFSQSLQHSVVLSQGDFDKTLKKAQSPISKAHIRSAVMEAVKEGYTLAEVQQTYSVRPELFQSCISTVQRDELVPNDIVQSQISLRWTEQFDQALQSIVETYKPSSAMAIARMLLCYFPSETFSVSAVEQAAKRLGIQRVDGFYRNNNLEC